MNYVEYYTANPSVKQINQTTRIEENKTDNGEKVAFKGNKKKIALTLAGMAAVGIAGILLYKKFNIPKESKVLQKEAEGIKEQADTVLSDAKKLVEDTISKIKETLKLTPEKIKEENGQKVFEEMQDGILRNKSFFTLENDKVILNSIERYKGNGIKDVVELDNNCVTFVLNNVKELADGAFEVAKQYNWWPSGELDTVYEGSKKLANGAFEAAKKFNWWLSGDLDTVYEGYKKLADGTLEVAKQYTWWPSGGFGCFLEGFKQLTVDEKTWETAKRFLFTNGKLYEASLGAKKLDDGYEITKGFIYKYKKGKLINITEEFI